MRVAINGFGRIGRTILRQILLRPECQDIEVVAINDIAPLESCVYLLRYDTVFGPLPLDVAWDGNVLGVAGRSIPMTNAQNISDLDLSDVDVVIECTGAANTRGFAGRGLAAGARNILISGPSPAAEVTVVIGANDEMLGAHRIVSNASCTTNALAPLLKAIHDDLGVRQGHMTTVHCYTGSQPMVDAPRASLARSRAGAVSMVPTTTSATQLVGRVLPELDGRISGAAVRVPAISVSCIDVTLQLDRQPEDGMRSYLAARFADHPPRCGRLDRHACAVGICGAGVKRWRSVTCRRRHFAA